MNGELAEIERKLVDLEADIIRENTEHELRLKYVMSIREDLLKQRSFVLAGLDTDLIATAESVLQIIGLFANAGEDKSSVLLDVRADIANGFVRLRTEYFGVKDYDRWHGQRHDCSYGCGPRHGHTIFSIGIRRDKLESKFTPHEIDACLYLIGNLERIQTEAVKR